METKSGLTLVELLILAVILGILAAIVIPQFTRASEEAKTSNLLSDLQTMRSQIELYKVQHNDALPGAGGATFEQAMTGQTDINGDVGTNYGPYVEKIPKNSFNDKDSIRLDGADAGANTDAWRFDSTTGAFQADDSAEHAAL